MTSTETLLQEAEAQLGHPMKRKADPYLAAAVMLPGGLGRKPPIYKQPMGSLTEGLRAQQPGMLRRAWDALLRRTPVPRVSRRWYLRRNEQQDQGTTPQCVAYTQKHWELAVPTINRAGLPAGEMYARCKAVDRWPGEDGTSADAMLTVCQKLGIVRSHWWWTHAGDDEAAKRWLLDIGPLWWGAGWSSSMFRTDREVVGLVNVEGPLIYGHETLVIGYTPNFTGRGPAFEIVNSWGNENFGLLGRGWILEPDFWRIMHETGDLVGVVEERAA